MKPPSFSPAIQNGLSRRGFLRQTAAAGAAAVLVRGSLQTRSLGGAAPGPTVLTAADLPRGSAPLPVPLPHFASRLHAYVWRNWFLVPLDRLARVVQAPVPELRQLGAALGLPPAPAIPADQWRRSALTILRRNWHLLPYEQLLDLLEWTPAQMAYTLREDDFLFIKFGSLKPRCDPLRWQPSDAATRAREAWTASVVSEWFPAGVGQGPDPLFGFVSDLSRPHTPRRAADPASARPRYCYSYFALYGDPFLDAACDPYPDGYLARLAEAGANGVWLQAVLSKLVPFPWAPALSEGHTERLRNLRALAARIRRQGLGLWLYLNEPRSLPLDFFTAHPELKGAPEGDHAALCTGHEPVRRWLRDAVASIARAAPELAGFFAITASENLSNCWSHGGGTGCPRCRTRTPAETIAEVVATFQGGLKDAGTPARLIAWDWGWADGWAPDLIARLPAEVTLMSVSEWSLPVHRGGIATSVGEYSISVVGPGPRATSHWELARQRGLKTMAKIQAGNTWELSAVPYIPAVANVAEHAVGLRARALDGLMLGWTLGGYPSPNLEVVAELTGAPPESDGPLTAEAAMRRVAARRYGARWAAAVVAAWEQCSAAFREFPYHGGLVYNAPMQYGPSNLLWSEPTGYRATMIGFPYDDLEGWRQVYPTDVFIAQFEKVAAGFETAHATLTQAVASAGGDDPPTSRAALSAELRVLEAASIHFRTTANQARFVQARRALAGATSVREARPCLAELERMLQAELRLARRLHDLQVQDSRLGFEASNQYYFIPVDLAEKALNCRDLLERWLPAQQARWAQG